MNECVSFESLRFLLENIEGPSVDHGAPTTLEGQTSPGFDPLVVSSQSRVTRHQHETLKVKTERIYPAAGPRGGDSATGTKTIQTEEQKHYREHGELDLKTGCSCITSCSTCCFQQRLKTQYLHHNHRHHQQHHHHHHDAATSDVLHHQSAQLHPAVLCRCIRSSR